MLPFVSTMSKLGAASPAFNDMVFCGLVFGQLFSGSFSSSSICKKRSNLIVTQGILGSFGLRYPPSQQYFIFHHIFFYCAGGFLQFRPQRTFIESCSAPSPQAKLGYVDEADFDGLPVGRWYPGEHPHGSDDQRLYKHPANWIR